MVRWFIALVVSVVLVGGAIAISVASGTGQPELPYIQRISWPACATGSPSSSTTDQSALIVFDSVGPWSDLSHVYTQIAGTLVSHFAEVKTVPSQAYQSGEIEAHDAVIYIGVNYAEPLPEPFLNDIRDTKRPVLWLGDNLWQLDTSATRAFSVDERYGMKWGGSVLPIAGVKYKGEMLQTPEGTTIHSVEMLDGRHSIVLAQALTSTGEQIPYSVRSDNLIWIAEVPFNYAVGSDRFLVFADLLNDVFPGRESLESPALVRLEDIGPRSDPDKLRDIADMLYSKGVPFSIAVYPVYVEALDDRREGGPESLAGHPDVVRAIEYMLDRGGTLVLHGYTHQYDDVANPLSGGSAEDYEFLRVEKRGDGQVIVGLTEEDSHAWVSERLDRAANEMRKVGLPVPEVFEFPHYGGSENAYEAVSGRFAARYDHLLLFSRAWDGASDASPHVFELSPPYLVQDPYSSVLIPETLGFVGADTDDVWTSVDELVDMADAVSVVRGGVASFFYHPFLGDSPLTEAIDRLVAGGYHFVSVCDL